MAFFRKSDMATHPADSRQQTPGGGQPRRIPPRLLLSCPVLSSPLLSSPLPRRSRGSRGAPTLFLFAVLSIFKKKNRSFVSIDWKERCTALHCTAAPRTSRTSQSSQDRLV